MTESDHDDSDDEFSEPTAKDNASGDFIWDETESAALWQALIDAKLVASTDSMRAFLKQADNVVTLSAAERSNWLSGSNQVGGLRGC